MFVRAATSRRTGKETSADVTCLRKAGSESDIKTQKTQSTTITLLTIINYYNADMKIE